MSRDILPLHAAFLVKLVFAILEDKGRASPTTSKSRNLAISRNQKSVLTLLLRSKPFSPDGPLLEQHSPKE